MLFSINYVPKFKRLTQHNLEEKMSNKEERTSYTSLVITQTQKDTILSTQY